MIKRENNKINYSILELKKENQENNKILYDPSDTCVMDIIRDRIKIPAHGLETGDIVKFNGNRIHYHIIILNIIIMNLL